MGQLKFDGRDTLVHFPAKSNNLDAVGRNFMAMLLGLKYLGGSAIPDVSELQRRRPQHFAL